MWLLPVGAVTPPLQVATMMVAAARHDATAFLLFGRLLKMIGNIDLVPPGEALTPMR